MIEKMADEIQTLRRDLAAARAEVDRLAAWLWLRKNDGSDNPCMVSERVKYEGWRNVTDAEPKARTSVIGLYRGSEARTVVRVFMPSIGERWVHCTRNGVNVATSEPIAWIPFPSAGGIYSRAELAEYERSKAR